MVCNIGPKTIFAPTNHAFRTLMREDIRHLTTSNAEAVSKLLKRSFIASSRILPEDITNEMIVDTISGEKLRFNIYNTVYIYIIICIII